MTVSESPGERREVLRVMSGYVVAVALFWLLFLLNSTHHWVSRRALVTTALGVGLLMCFSGVAMAVLGRRRQPKP
jgi:hypothetical protein